MKTNELINSEALTMSSRDIAELLESRHDKVKQSMERLESKGLISFTPMGDMVSIGSGAKREATIYQVNKRDSYVVVAQLSPEFTARLVDRWQELESKQAFEIPQTLGDALLLAGELANRNAELEVQRDEAVKTKAEIGSKREATAMATASAASRKAEQLEVELDESKNYFTIKRVQMLFKDQKFNWRKLKATSIDMGIEIKEAFDQNYGSVKTYHADVWGKAYGISKELF